jgi:predicted enzyme related to lactoylglutathione lyase
MTNRASAPIGAPCWVDLWTSDVERIRRFYSELFGWEAQPPSPEHGGYFVFTRQGVPVAGTMGDTGEMRADNTWKPYLATDDIERSLKLAGEHGATVHAPAMVVDNLGSQAVIVDPSGAAIGIWQPGSFAGFTVINEPGAVLFVAIDVHDYQAQIAFYRRVFGWEPAEEEVDDHHYAGFMDPETGRPLAGIGDEVENLEPGEAPVWSVIWQCDDVDAAATKVRSLGGTVIKGPTDGGLGRSARVADPAGARFWLCQAKGN